MSQDIMHDMAREAGRHAPLGAGEEAELMRRWAEHGDIAARDAVLRAHLRMSLGAAARHGRPGRERADLVQQANLAMVTAAAKFEPGRNLRFSTYARWWVRAGVQESLIGDETAPSAGGKARRTLFFHHGRTRRAVERDLGPDAPRRDVDAEVARLLGVTPEEAHGASLGAGRVSSLDAPAGDDTETTRGDLLPSDGPDPHEALEAGQEAAAARAAISAALATLAPRERLVVESRRYCEDGDEMTLDALGAMLGISKERVRQVEGRALGKLRDALAVAGLAPG